MPQSLCQPTPPLGSPCISHKIPCKLCEITGIPSCPPCPAPPCLWVPLRFAQNRADFVRNASGQGWLWGGRGACGWGLLDIMVNSGRRCLFLPAKMCSKMLRRCLAGAFCAGRCWQGFGAAASFCQISLNTALRWYFPGGRGGFFAGCAAAWQNKCGCTVRRFGRGNPSCR